MRRPGSAAAPIRIAAKLGQAQDQRECEGGGGEGHDDAGDDHGLRHRIAIEVARRAASRDHAEEQEDPAAEQVESEDPAQRVGLAVTPESDRSYTPFLVGMSVQQWRYNTFLTCLGEDLARELSQYPMINTGLFAARADSPVWAHWAEVLGNFFKTVGEPFFYAEQAMLNALIRKRLVGAALLPARCNWMCNLAAPRCSVDGAILCEVEPPFEPLGIIHLTGPNKTGVVELETVAGGAHKRSLRFQGVVGDLG